MHLIDRVAEPSDAFNPPRPSWELACDAASAAAE